MKKNRSIIAAVIISILFSGCAPYRFVKIDKGSELIPGYYVSRRSVFIDELVFDENDKPPQDLSVAKERFKRRRKTVENWYKRYYPFALEESPLISSLKSFFFLPFLPLVWAMVILRQPSEKELARQDQKYATAKEKMRQFIEEDCRKEALAK